MISNIIKEKVGCALCGGEIKQKRGYHKDKKYCSYECNQKAHRLRLKEKRQLAKQTEWGQKLKTLMVMAVADSLLVGRSRPITQDCSDVTIKHWKKISKFIQSLLSSQRQQAVNEEREICKEKMAQSNEWWNQKLKSVKQLSITETIENVEEMDCMTAKIQFIKVGREQYGMGWCDGRQELREELCHQISLLKVKNNK